MTHYRRHSSPEILTRQPRTQQRFSLTFAFTNAIIRLEFHYQADRLPARLAYRATSDRISFGTDTSGDRASTIETIIATAKLNGLDPEAYLRTIITRIANHPAKGRRQLSSPRVPHGKRLRQE